MLRIPNWSNVKIYIPGCGTPYSTTTGYNDTINFNVEIESQTVQVQENVDDTSLSSLHALVNRYKAISIQDPPSDSNSFSTPTKKNNRDAVDLVPLTPSTPSSAPSTPSTSRALVPSSPSVPTPPTHLMSIQAIIRQIGEMEKEVARKVQQVEVITEVLHSMIRVCNSLS